jgi:hypothetical protein
VRNVKIAEEGTTGAMAASVLGEEGLALAAGAGDLFEKLIDDVPEGFSIRLEVSFPRDYSRKATLTVARDFGSVDFDLWHTDRGLELAVVNAQVGRL